MDDLNKVISLNSTTSIDQIIDTAIDAVKTEKVSEIEKIMDRVVANIGNAFRSKLEDTFDLIIEETCSNHHIMLIKNDEELKGVLKLFSWTEQSEHSDKNDDPYLEIGTELNESQTKKGDAKVH